MPNLISKSGIVWNYEVEGKGKPIVFIHGWGVDHRIWRQQIKHFVQEFQVIAFDLPGHGNTTWQPVNLSIVVEDIDFLLKTLNVQKAIIVGSSLGGLVGLKYYSLFPGKVEKMIFVGSMPKFSQSKDYPFGLDVDKIRKLDTQLDSSYPSIINIFFRSLFTNEERASRRFKWLQRFRRTEGFADKKALSHYLSILENEDLRNNLKVVSAPVQFINGREDTICCCNTVEYLKTLLPQARYDFFEKCGHFPFLSKPYEFNALLESFIKEESKK